MQYEWAAPGKEIVCTKEYWDPAKCQGANGRPGFMKQYKVLATVPHPILLNFIGVVLDTLPDDCWALWDYETGILNFQPVQKLADEQSIHTHVPELT